MSEFTREQVAYHEAGHAGMALSLGRSFRYVTIRETEKALGHMKNWRLPQVVLSEEGSDLRTESVQKARGRPVEPASERRVAERIGIPRTTIQEAEAHTSFHPDVEVTPRGERLLRDHIMIPLAGGIAIEKQFPGIETGDSVTVGDFIVAKS